MRRCPARAARSVCCLAACSLTSPPGGGSSSSTCPSAVAVAWIAPRGCPTSAARGGHLDVPGAVTVTVATTALVYGLVRAPTDGWADTDHGGVPLPRRGAVSPCSSWWRRRRSYPLMPLRLFANRNRAAAYAVMLCTSAAIFAVFFFLTQLLQKPMATARSWRASLSFPSRSASQ